MSERLKGRSATISRLLAAALVGALLGSCSAQAPFAGPAPASPQSILAASMPAAGAKVRGPVNELVLNFAPPARLDEVTVTGPDGTMPMMITAVGETAHYSIPLSGLGAGAYTVAWRATAAGQQHQGSFNFTVE